ncbi:hypothetical protein ACL9RF_02875 [Sphingobacterium sp. Mn56C]|uniref:hypothetical protein n=1 Tax=Sphingobacterium sp. Mn56C TaxID=3395261 RepID=UPI003BDE8B0F
MKFIPTKGGFMLLLTLFFLNNNTSQAQQIKVLPAEVQIRVAVMAAPAEKRDGAKVWGYDPEGKPVELRKGTNDFVCLAPKPNTSVIYSYAYPQNLEPFMARGRALVAEGKNTKEKNDIREAEINAGKLFMPQGPNTLFCYWGKLTDLDTETGEIKNALRRYVIYVPYATAASTGLSDKVALPGMPWLMDAGSYKAHIMITPENVTHAHAAH